MEANTLLEPGNNSAANQNEQDEIAEVSTQLASIKKKHDEAKKLVRERETEFEYLKKEIEIVNQQEQSAGSAFDVKQRIEHLMQEIEMTQHRIAEETMCKHSYQHMI